MSTATTVEMPSTDPLPDVAGLTGEDAAEAKGRGAWFPRLVGYYLRRRYAPGRAVTLKDDGRTAAERATAVIRRACIASAVTGASSGAVSTLAEVLTAETEGLATFVTLPTAAVTVGGEMVLRSYLHLSLTCDLADIFGVDINPDDPSDIWRLYALAFKTEGHGEGDDPGQELVHRVVHVEGEQVGEKIGVRLLGESIVRNILPVAGIVTSSVSNWRMTKHVGDTIRRYMRYHRALEDALDHTAGACHAVLDLLIEGCWHLFVADGRLNSEEAALLANLLKKLPVIERSTVLARFTDDEHGWSERIQVVPEGTRDAFMRALEVAAAVDKVVGLPERKILRRAARKLGRDFDPKHVEAMMRDFEETGVIAAE